MTHRTLAVVSAGLSQPSSTRLLADQLADATRDALQADGSTVDVVVIELRDLAHDIVNNLITGFPSPVLAKAISQLVAADGVIAVSPLFNASYSGLFKSFFDVLDRDALAGKPVLMAATGGTTRHSLALDHAMRPMFTYLRAVVTPTSVFAATADWGSVEESVLVDRVHRAGAEFAELVRRTEAVAAVDPFSSVTPFEDLLGHRG
jgi:FMN reductase